MSYEALIKINDPKKVEVLKTEFEDLKTERFEIKTEENIKITAKDAIAFKSALMSLAKSLEVYEKMEGIKDE